MYKLKSNDEERNVQSGFTFLEPNPELCQKEKKAKAVRENAGECLKKYYQINRERLPDCLWSDADVEALTEWISAIDMAYFIEVGNAAGNKYDAYNHVIGDADPLKKGKFIKKQDQYALELWKYGIDIEELTEKYVLYFDKIPASLGDIPDRCLCQILLRRLSIIVSYPGGEINSENLLRWLEYLTDFESSQIENYKADSLADILIRKGVIGKNQAVPYDTIKRFVHMDVASDEIITFSLTEDGKELVEFWKNLKEYAR